MDVIDLFRELADNDFGFFQKISTIDSIMSKQVVSVSLDHTHTQVEETLQKHQIHHLPVLDDDGDIVGVVSDRDVLRHRPPFLGKAAQGDDDHRAGSAPASRFMTRGVLAVSRDATPLRALSLMLQQHVDSVLVHDQQRQLQGIVTIRDFVALLTLFYRVCSHEEKLHRFRLVDLDLRHGLPLDSLFNCGTSSVRDVMTKDVLTIAATEPLAKAIELMRVHKLRHLPVLDEVGSLQGMLSDRDILRALPTPKAETQHQTATEFRERLFATDNREALDTRVGTVANRNDTRVAPSMLFSKAIRNFQDQETCGLAVVEPTNGELCGIVTSTDLLRVIRNALLIAAGLTGREQEDEAACDFIGGEKTTAV